MNAKITVTGINKAEQVAKEILEHIEAIKKLQQRASWDAYMDVEIELCDKD